MLEAIAWTIGTIIGLHLSIIFLTWWLLVIVVWEVVSTTATFLSRLVMSAYNLHITRRKQVEGRQ